jgi:L-arabinose isomerase
MANALLRTGTPYCVVSDDWRAPEFKAYVADWAAAAQTVSALKDLRIAVVGRMPGMGDILVDPHALMRKLGPEVHPVVAGEIHAYLEKATDQEIDAVIEENAANFDIDPKLTDDSHRYAARMQVAFENYMTDGGFGAFSAYFNTFGYDGRFRQLPLMAASNLMAKGYGYGAEGDACCTALVSAGHTLIGDAHFTEMYAMDFERDSILMSHMGEGNWKVARKDRKPRLIDRPLGIGDLDNPPTVLFQAEPGPATLVNLVTLEGELFRLVVSYGEVLDTEELPNVEMPYFHLRPESGCRDCLDGWLENGGTHHQCLNLGDHRRRWELFCSLADVEYEEV